MEKNQNKCNIFLIIFAKNRVLNISAICSLLFLKLCVQYGGGGGGVGESQMAIRIVLSN